MSRFSLFSVLLAASILTSCSTGVLFSDTQREWEVGLESAYVIPNFESDKTSVASIVDEFDPISQPVTDENHAKTEIAVVSETGPPAPAPKL